MSQLTQMAEAFANSYGGTVTRMGYDFSDDERVVTKGRYVLTPLYGVFGTELGLNKEDFRSSKCISVTDLGKAMNQDDREAIQTILIALDESYPEVVDTLLSHPDTYRRLMVLRLIPNENPSGCQNIHQGLSMDVRSDEECAHRYHFRDHEAVKRLTRVGRSRRIDWRI